MPEVKTEKKPRKSPVPQSAERITAGALKLEIEDMITLRDQLTEKIGAGLKERKEKLDQGKSDFERLSKLVNGNGTAA